MRDGRPVPDSETWHGQEPRTITSETESPIAAVARAARSLLVPEDDAWTGGHPGSLCLILFNGRIDAAGAELEGPKLFFLVLGSQVVVNETAGWGGSERPERTIAKLNPADASFGARVSDVLERFLSAARNAAAERGLTRRTR